MEIVDTPVLCAAGCGRPATQRIGFARKKPDVESWARVCGDKGCAAFVVFQTPLLDRPKVGA